jgi:hypothetical protein
VQLPGLIIQYKHRLSGHLSEAELHLVQFKTIADRHYQGDLSAMIIKYQANSELSIVNTAEIIMQLMSRVDYLQSQLSGLSKNAYIEQVYNFIIYADITIIKDTLTDFSITIPLAINALVTGAVIAIFSLLIKEIVGYLIRMISKKMSSEKQFKKR